MVQIGKNKYFNWEVGGGVGWGVYLLFTFVLLNRGVPDVETIYFLSTEQKKKNCLQKLPGLLVSKKDEVICSANK